MNQTMSARSAPLVTILALGAGACDTADEPVAPLSVAVTVSEAGATNPTVATVPGGPAYVSWVGTTGGEYNVFLAAADAPEGQFAEPVRVNDIPGDAAPHEQAPAQVAVGPGGEVYVLWQNNTEIEGRRFPASDLRLAVSRDGGRTFAPAITVNDDAGGPPSSHTFHDMVVGDDGSVLISWIDGRRQDAARAAGTQPEPGPEIRIARSIDGGATFSPSAVVDSNACPCCRTAVAVGPDGSTYVAWRKVFDGDIRDIVVARAEPGTLDFGEPVRVHADDWVFPGCPHAGPAIELDGSGRLHVGWYTGKEDRQGLWYAASEDRGASFSEPVPLLTAEWVPPSQVVMARSDGAVWMAWEDLTAETPALQIARAPGPDAAVRTERRVDTGRSPAMGGGGVAALLAWLDGESVRATWTGAARLAAR